MMRRRDFLAGLAATSLGGRAHGFPIPTTAEMSGPYLRVGDFRKIYDPSLGATEEWWINDHCFVYGPDAHWHLFGITLEQPHNPEFARYLDDRIHMGVPYEERLRQGMEMMRSYREAAARGEKPAIDFAAEDDMAHARSPSLFDGPWVRKPYAFRGDEALGENRVLAPHVVRKDGLYYMVYSAGEDNEREGYWVTHLATSPDLENWTRYENNPLFSDYYNARDAMIMPHGEQWVMYYKANSEPQGGNHTVAYRTSADLVHWSDRKTCFTDRATGTMPGTTESPVVVRRGPWYYLFLSVREDYNPGAYTFMEVFRSRDPFHWELSDRVGEIRSHAGDVVRDVDGQWYLSHCGWYQGGVYLAPLEWTDGVDESDTSIPVPSL